MLPADPCTTNPCQNSGTCTVTYDSATTTYGYYCACVSGYFGTDCDSGNFGMFYARFICHRGKSDRIFCTLLTTDKENPPYSWCLTTQLHVTAEAS